MSNRKIPGMVWMFTSFMPWLLYWILSSIIYPQARIWLAVLLPHIFDVAGIVFSSLFPKRYVKRVLARQIA